MARPIPIREIYQPLKICSFDRTCSIFDLLADGTSAAIFAGPGCGKSTLLNRLCVDLLGDANYTPFLFILRSSEAAEDCVTFVDRLSKGKKPKNLLRKNVPVLLVDGYDEISREQRQKISSALAEFASLKLGVFFLTCRSWYDVYDLRVPHYNLAAFTIEHQRGFIAAFSRCYEANIDADDLLKRLQMRGLVEFASHPLILTFNLHSEDRSPARTAKQFFGPFEESP